MLTAIPLTVIPLIIYNVIALIFPGTTWTGEIFRLTMVSGAPWALTLSDLMITLGITMRLAQGAVVPLSTPDFYALMTMHGLGMAGTLFSAGIAMVWFVAARHARPSRAAMWVAYVLFVAGAVALLVATLIGKFAAGWYALYPLPFLKATWPGWATLCCLPSFMRRWMVRSRRECSTRSAAASRNTASRSTPAAVAEGFAWWNSPSKVPRALSRRAFWPSASTRPSKSTDRTCHWPQTRFRAMPC